MTLRPFSIRFPAALALAALAAGCRLGPDYERPWTAASDAEAYVHAEAPALDARAVEPWWRTFGDPVTAELVEAALDANTDLAAAAARVLEARAALVQAGSRRVPEVSAGLSATRQKNSFVLPNVGRVSPIATTYSDNLSVSYQADLFGALRRGKEAAWAELLGEEAARDTVTHTVISEVVRARVRLATLARAADVARAIRESWADTLATTERRYENGLVQTLDLRLARENLASAEAAVVRRDRELEQAGLALDILLGRRPGTGEAPATGLEPLPELGPVPLGLPADLLDRRPDLRQAEMRIAAATARIGVAVADLFPGLTLTGAAGTTSDSLGDLASSDSLVYNAVASIVGPIFDGGRRRAAVRSARAAADAAAASYAGAVLTALREVEDALVRDVSLRQEVDFLERRLEEARAADGIARARYGRGVLDLLGTLETERRLRAAEEALITAQADLWNARIDLHLALGGDWLPGDRKARFRVSRVAANARDNPEKNNTHRNREDP